MRSYQGKSGKQGEQRERQGGRNQRGNPSRNQKQGQPTNQRGGKGKHPNTARDHAEQAQGQQPNRGGKGSGQHRGGQGNAWRDLPQLRGKVDDVLQAIRNKEVDLEPPERPAKRNRTRDDAPNKENPRLEATAKSDGPQPVELDEQAVKDLLSLYEPHKEAEKEQRGVLRQYNQNGFPNLQYYQAPQWRFFREPKPHLNQRAKTSAAEGLEVIDKVEDRNAGTLPETRTNKMQNKTIGNRAGAQRKKSSKDQKTQIIEKRLQKTNEMLKGAKERPFLVELPKAKNRKDSIPVDSDFESYGEESDGSEASSKNEAATIDPRPAQILNRALRKNQNNPSSKKSSIGRRQATRLRDRKRANYDKQEQEIFEEDFNPRKCKTVNRKQYVNNASRPYDDDSDDDDHGEDEDSEDEEAVAAVIREEDGPDSDELSEGKFSEDEDEIEPKRNVKQGRTAMKVEAPAQRKEEKFDLKREKNRSNQVFSLGQSREDHKKLEKAAKEKKMKNQGGKRKDDVHEKVSVPKDQQTHRKQKRSSQNNTELFPRHLVDRAEIDKNLAKGEFFKGVIKMNSNFRHRAYVSVKELKVDVLVDGHRNMNRALDGDEVAVWLERTKFWKELPGSSQVAQKMDGEARQGYANDQAIESRVVDEVEADEGHQSGSNSLESDRQNHNANESSSEDADTNRSRSDVEEQLEEANANTTPVKPEDFLTIIDSPASRSPFKTESDQSFADIKDGDCQGEDQNQRVLLQKVQEGDDDSDWESVSSEEEQKPQGDQKRRIYSLVEAADVGRTQRPQAQPLPRKERKYSNNADSQREENNDKSKKPPKKEKIVINQKLKGDLEQRIKQINEISQTHRPQGRVMAILCSPNRDREQMCLLKEMDAQGKDKKQGGKRKNKKAKKNAKDEQTEKEIYLVPVNQKLPWFSPVAVPAEYYEDIENGKKPSQRYYIVSFREWTIFQKKPICSVTESIGEAGNLDAESMRLLKMYDICCEAYENEDQEPTENVHECLKMFADDIDPETKEWIIPQSEIDKRVDLRQKRIFTIDPLTAKDLDDALSVEKITESVYEIGVHIADVSYFVQQGTDLDKEAVKRCTSTYFVHRVYPMLPRLLCERLCSLNPKVDRLAYSIFFKMNKDTGELLEHEEPRIARTVIRSCAKWHYGLVQQILDREVQLESQLEQRFKPQGQTFDDMVQDCFLMNEISQKRRKIRLDNGSVMFLNREFTFDLDQETRLPTQYREAQKMQSKALVEEFMLLANILVARHLFKYCKDKTLLRVHNDIESEKKEKLNTFFKQIGLGDVDLTNAKTLSKSIEDLKSRASLDDLNVMNRKFLTCLAPAQYVTIEDKEPSRYQHYGLNFPLYTHFTSPIRRYADLLVHRLLTICLKHKEETRGLIENIDYAQYAEMCSEKSLNARKAGKDCQRLFHCLLLKAEGPRVYDALVFDVDGQHAHVSIEEINQHHKIKLTDDPRISKTEFFPEQLLVSAIFKKEQALADGLKTYQERQLQRQPEKDEPEEDSESPRDQARTSEALCIGVFDRIKLRVEATEEFPLDIKCRLLITQEDMTEYEEIQGRMKQVEEARARDLHERPIIQQEEDDRDG